MGINHTVKQGEHLSSIARRYGFSDYKIIWNDPNNVKLKEQRKNPNVLYPGDQLYIRDKEEKQESRSTEQHHTFQIKNPKLELRLVLEDQFSKPIKNAQCELHVENQVLHLTSDGLGHINQSIPATAENALLIIKDPKTPLNEMAIPIKIGHLDPVEEQSGQLSRLNNLGYFAGPLESASKEENQALFLSAVEEFQCDHGLTVDGKCGPLTQTKLRRVHGC
jgi:Putative peptidoglycan binding domain/LysM domain